MRRQLPPTSSFFLAGILALIFGCAFGYWLLGEHAQGGFPDWIDLGAPEGSFSRLQLFDAHRLRQAIDIYVMTDNGDLFMAPFSGSRPWIEVEEGPSKRYYFAEDCLDEYHEMASQSRSYPDQQILACRKYVWNWEMIADDTFVVLTQDGAVWVWHYSPSIERLLQYSLLGIGIGLILVTLLWVAARHLAGRWRAGSQFTA